MSNSQKTVSVFPTEKIVLLIQKHLFSLCRWFLILSTFLSAATNEPTLESLTPKTAKPLEWPKATLGNVVFHWKWSNYIHVSSETFPFHVNPSYHPFSTHPHYTFCFLNPCITIVLILLCPFFFRNMVQFLVMKSAWICLLSFISHYFLYGCHHISCNATDLCFR